MFCNLIDVIGQTLDSWGVFNIPGLGDFLLQILTALQSIFGCVA